MSQEKSAIITYRGTPINLFSDERDDYINLTDMATAWKNRKSIGTWLKNKQTIDFMSVWEKKNNANFRVLGLEDIKKNAGKSNFSLSVKDWVERTNAKGIFSRMGSSAGTWAHKDIAIKFAGWLNPEFELFIIEEIQRLKQIERQKNSYELLSHDQILHLVRLKEVFKYVAHQEIIEDAHKEFYAAMSTSKNPFSEFNAWRNKILGISPDVINQRIKQYCIDNKIGQPNRYLSKSKREKLLILDSYDAVRNAVWDFLKIQGEINALNLANLVGNMMRIEKGEILIKNETNLFHERQDLGEYNDFATAVGSIKQIKAARETLNFRHKAENHELSAELRAGKD